MHLLPLNRTATVDYDLAYRSFLQLVTLKDLDRVASENERAVRDVERAIDTAIESAYGAYIPMIALTSLCSACFTASTG